MLQEIIQPYIASIEKNLLKIEVIIFSLTTIGCILIITNSFTDIGRFIIVLSLGTISLIYFLISNKEIKSEVKIKIFSFSSKITFWGLSISCIALLFAILNYPGAYMMIYSGMLSLGISLFLNIYLIKLKENKDVKKSLITRILISLLVLSSLIVFKPMLGYDTPHDNIDKKPENEAPVQKR